MLKKDGIFWAATGIFLVSAALAAITKQQLWLFLMVASYLLRPTLASLGIARHLIDERQMSIQYRSGNIAFAVMMVASVSLAVWQNAKGDPSWEMFTIVIMLGLAAKALFNVLLVKNYRVVGRRIILTAGLLVLLFVGAENGLSVGGLVESAPWLVILGLGLASKKYPRTVAIVVFVATAFLLIVILAKGFTPGQVATALLVCIPLSIAGICLLIPEKNDRDADFATPDPAKA